MPRCEGRPDGACPAKVNNASVVLCQGDLMLCKQCEEYRFPTAVVSESKNLGKSTVTQSTAFAATASAVTTSPSEGAVLTDECDINSSCKLIVNELLYFLANKFDNLPRCDIKTTITDFYQEEEIFAAKMLLIKCVSVSLPSAVSDMPKKRIGEKKLERSVDDILNIFNFIDENDSRGHLPTFCAVNMSRVPVPTEELSDLAIIRTELSRLRKEFDVFVKFCSHNTSGAVMPPSDANAGSDNSSHVSYRDAHRDVVDSHGQVCNMNNIPAEELTTVSTVDTHLDENSAPHLDYAAMANSCAPDDFQIVRNRKADKPKKKRIVIGGSVNVNAFKGVAKKAVVSVNRLDADTSTATVSEYLKAQGINVYSCYAVTPKDFESRRSRFIGMRICISSADVNKVLDTDMWPVGVIVRPWVFKSTVSTNAS